MNIQKKVMMMAVTASLFMAAVAVSKPITRNVGSVEQAQEAMPSEATKCAACGGKPGDEPKKAANWVAVDSSNNAGCCAKLECALNTLAENKCCKKVKAMLKEQGEAAEKCCRHIRHDLEDIEDLVISQTDAAAVCCSVTETNIGDPCTSSVVNILDIEYANISPTDVSTVDAACLSALSLLKTIYTLVADIHTCSCDL